jgi:hypothetical protein
MLLSQYKTKSGGKIKPVISPIRISVMNPIFQTGELAISGGIIKGGATPSKRSIIVVHRMPPVYAIWRQPLSSSLIVQASDRVVPELILIFYRELSVYSE